MNTPLNPTREELIAFLDGSGTIDGLAFGDSDHYRPHYWWRKFLPLLANTPASSTAQPAMGDNGYFTDEHGDGIGMVHPTYGVGVFFTEDCRKRDAQPSDATAQPSDPLDWKIPCDITVGAGTIRKGCSMRTVVLRMEVLHRMAMKAAQPRVDLTDERAAFEAWWVSQPHRCKPAQFNDGEYKSPAVYAAWNVWQARAALDSTAQADHIVEANKMVDQDTRNALTDQCISLILDLPGLEGIEAISALKSADKEADK